MEEIKIFVEDLLSMTGLTGSIIPVLRHVSMVVVAILLAWLSDWLCRRLLVPLVMKLTAKTDVEWDDHLFNRRVLISACHIVPAVTLCLQLSSGSCCLWCSISIRLSLTF